ncbi:MAG: FtsX-like permease family protein, partial [Acidimicrobiia bacterium]
GWVYDTIERWAPEAKRLEYRAEWTRIATREGARLLDVDLDNDLADGILAMAAGRQPISDDEIVLSENAADLMDASIGDTIALPVYDNVEFEVVGIASHPVLWDVNDLVLSPDGFDRLVTTPNFGDILLLEVDDDQDFASRFAERWEASRYQFYPAHRDWPKPQHLYAIPEDFYAVMSDEELAEAERIISEQGEEAGWNYVYGLFPNGIEEPLPQTYAQSRSDMLVWNADSLVGAGPVVGTGVAAVILAEVAFIAGAAFATGTRRRLREIGLMSANGASDKHVRTTVIGEGLVVGLLGGVGGSFIAFLLITLGRPLLQGFVSRRIEGFPFSPLDVIGPILVAVAACVIAAWLPAKTASAVPTLTALQGRMPVGAPKRWIVPSGAGLTAFGALLVPVGLAGASGGAAAVGVLGAVLTIGGASLLAGPLVAWIAKHAERFPITSRIVLRDSGRQRGRAAAAVAATMVILMAPVVGLIAQAQSEASQAIFGLPVDHPQALIEGAYDEDYNVVPLAEDHLSAAAAMLPQARIARFDAIDVPVKYPAELAATEDQISETGGSLYHNSFRVAVASSELTDMLASDRLEEILAEDDMALIGVEDRVSQIEVDGEPIAVSEVPIAVQRWSFPRVIVTQEAAERLDGYARRPQALLEVDETWLASINPFSTPLTPLWESEQGLEMSGGGDQLSSTTVFVFVFLATMAVVLIVVATITALSAAESDRDMQTVVAVGAENSIRRKYLGLQSGIHTLLGAILAVPLTLLLVWTVYNDGSINGGWSQVGYFGYFDSSQMIIPWPAIAALVVGLPLIIGTITALTVRSAHTTPPRRAT